MYSVKLEDTQDLNPKLAKSSSSVIHVTYKGDAHHRGSIPFTFDDTTTIRDFKKKIVEHQIEWRRSRKSENVNVKRLPMIRVLKLCYRQQITKFGAKKESPCQTKSTYLIPDDDTCISTLNCSTLIAHLSIPDQWRDIAKRKSQSLVGETNLLKQECGSLQSFKK